MTPRIEISESQLADLTRISQLGVSRLGTILSALSATQRPIIHSVDLLTLVKDALGTDNASAEAVCRQALAFNGLIRQANVSITEVRQSLKNAIEDIPAATENPDFASVWADCEASFFEIVNAQSVWLTAKAVSLSYDFANLYRQVRILTDIRPIFDNDGESIKAAVISYTLRLRYDNVEGDHDISIAMDEEDVRRLRDQCERAMRKAEKGKELMNTFNIPSVISGERNADD